MIGSTPQGRFTEQHDIFFAIHNSLQGLIPQIKDFWPKAEGKLYIDVWRQFVTVPDFTIEIIAEAESENLVSDKLFLLIFLYKKSTRENGCF